MDDRSPEHDRSPDYADMYSPPNSMGNVTDTMTRLIKPLLYTAVVAVFTLGLSAGTAFGQTYLDPSQSGTGGTGTQSDPYLAGEFADALSNAGPGGTIVVLDSGSLNDQTGLTQEYNLSSTAGGDITLQSEGNGEVTLTLDLDLNLETFQLTLEGIDPSGSPDDDGVNVEFPGNNISLLADGAGAADDVVTGGGSPDANRLVFSGPGQIVDLNQGGGITTEIARVEVTETGVLTFDGNNTGANPPLDRLRTNETLSVAGELDVGGSNLSYGGPGGPTFVDVGQDGNDLNVSGTVMSGQRFDILMNDPGGVFGTGGGGTAPYVVEGKGDVEVPVTYFTEFGNGLQRVVFEQTSIGQFGFSRFGIDNSGNERPVFDVDFPFLEEVRASILIDGDVIIGGVPLNNVVEFGDPTPDPNVSPSSGFDEVFAGASTSLTVQGTFRVVDGLALSDAEVETAPDLALTVNGPFEMSGAQTTVNFPTTDTDPASFASPQDPITSAVETPVSFDGGLTLNGGDLNLRAPGPVEESVKSEINGTLDLAGGRIQLEDETSTNPAGARNGQGLHNLAINGDAQNLGPGTINDNFGSGLGTEEDVKVFLEGSTTQNLNVSAGGGPFPIERLVVDNASTDLTTAASGDKLQVTDQITLRDGIFTANANLDANGAGARAGAGGDFVTLVRFKNANGHGQLRAGSAPIAYTGQRGGDGSGNSLVETPDRIEYRGTQDISTGDELIGPAEPAVDRRATQFAVDMTVRRGNVPVVVLNPDYTIRQGGTLEILGGNLSLGAASMTISNGVTFVRGDGALDSGPVPPEDALELPTVANANVGTTGIVLRYVNTTDVEVGIEWPTVGRNANVVQNVQVSAGSDDAVITVPEGGPRRVNNTLNLTRGVLDVNGQTIQHSGPTLAGGGVSGGAVAYNWRAEMQDSGGDGLFQFIGGDRRSPSATNTTPVNARTSSSAGTTFPFPTTEVDKGPRSVVNFNINDRNGNPTDGFSFGGVTISDAQNFDGTGDGDGLTRVDGVNFGGNTDRLSVDGNFVQNAGSFDADNGTTLVTFEISGDLTKEASDSTRFIANAEEFTVGTSENELRQESGTFRVDNTSRTTAATQFTVNGDLENNSSVALDFNNGPSNNAEDSDAFEVNEAGVNQGAFEVTGTVTQTAGRLDVAGYGNSGSVTVGDSFDHQDGVTDIPNASAVDVTNDVTVTAGNFLANLSDNTGTPAPNNTFEASTLTVGDSTDAGGSAGDILTASATDALFDAAPAANITTTDDDFIRITGETSIRYDAQLVLQGQELRLEDNLDFLGAGDQLARNNGRETSGLRGTVRFVGSETQTVETDGTSDTYLNGLVVDAERGVDLELASNVSTNRLVGAFNFGSAGGAVRNFGTVALERGNIVTGEDSLTVLEPAPTSSNDLIEANNADETNPASPPPTNNQTAVLGGSRNSHVVGTLRRAIDETTGSTGGFVGDGYVYPMGDGETYSAVAIEPAADFGDEQLFTVDIIDDPGVELPDDFTVAGEDPNDGSEIQLDLNVKSEPFFRVNTEGVPDENVNVRAIAGGLSGDVNAVKQLRIVQYDTTASSVQLAGTYDFNSDPADDFSPPNSFISGVPNVHHEGVDFREGSVIGLASDSEYNPGLQDQPNQVTIAGQVTYAGNAGIEGVDVTAISGDTSVTTTTDANGNYSFPGLTPGSYEVTTSVSGEPQGINATDALLAVQFFAGSASLSDFQQELADVNDSGDVNATDALLIAQFASGNVSSFEAGTFASTSDSTDASTGASGVDLEVAAYGDVNLSGGVGSSSSQRALSVTKAEGVSVSTSAKTAGASAAPGEDAISVPVSLDRSAELGAYTLSIEYPAETVSFEGVSSEDVLARDADGTVHLAWFDRSGDQPLSLNAGDAFVTMRFTPAEGAEDGSLKIENVEGELAGADATTLSGVGLQVPEVGLGGPESFAFDGNYPNPVGQRTTISFDLPEQANVSLEVYDVLGRKVMTVPKQSMSAGADRSLSVDASGLSSGTYLYRLQVEMGDQTIRETDQMNVVR
jgi:hypothetical protein